jgi:2-keto-3-deoxy-6-phosphogluconate aldolase
MLRVYNKAHPRDPLPTVQEAVDAGACYVVSAGNFSDESFEKFVGSIPMMPGCGTVSEIISQFSKGANLCKIFPAKQLGGPDFVKAIDPAIHKTISLVPTGGTNASNIPDYIDVGVLVLGGSFSMIEKAAMQRIIDEQDYDLLADELAKTKRLIDGRRAQRYTNLDFSKASLEQISQITGRDFNVP